MSNIKRSNTYPLPTRERWIDEVQKDPDIALVVQALAQGGIVEVKDLHNPEYMKAWKKGRVEAVDGILYEYEEPKASHIRQLRRVVVPASLKPVIIAAYHATPMAGHVSFYKTYYRIATRFWWPGMTTDIRKEVQGCGHCQAANMTSHKAQKTLQAISYDEPFDVTSMDVWVPGKVKPTSRHQTEAHKKLLRKIQDTASLTYLDAMTGFATSATLKEVSSGAVAVAAFTELFVNLGLPKLILIDEGSEFKATLIRMLDHLGVKHYVVSPENHDGILNERFHRYLNKVQKIGAADMDTYEQWRMNVAFATYGWNAAPIDGTDIQRAFVAKARNFRFPLDDFPEDLEIPRIPNASQALEHIDRMFPLWSRQKVMLKVLNEERRNHHRQLQDKNKKSRRFDPGDLVIVRRQVQSSASQGAPAKLQFRARGPYKVISQAPQSENSYILRRVAAERRLIGTTQPRLFKEASFRLEKLPSHVVIHKRVDTPDTRLARTQQILARNPLERTLGLPDFGRYVQAAPGEECAFVKVNEMWEEIVDEPGESDDEAAPEVRQALEEEQRTEGTAMTRGEQARGETRGREDTADGESPRAKRRRVTTQAAHTQTMKLQMLYEKVLKSKGKLFIIAQADEGNIQKTWHIVRVELEETENQVAKETGRYHCLWYFKAPTPAAKFHSCNCPYWPLIKELDSAENYKAIIPLRPDRVDKAMEKNPNLRWYQKGVNLLEDAVAGPFDFDPGYKVPPRQFKELVRVSSKKDIDASDVYAVVPHKLHKRTRKR